MYVRMIAKREKWIAHKEQKMEALSSDIITVCLRTKDETLSLWEVDSENDISDAIVALAANKQMLGNVDYIIIHDENLKKYLLNINNNSEGKSPFDDFNKQHRDIIGLNYTALGDVSRMILELLSTGAKIEREKSNRVGLMLLDAIFCDKLDIAKMDSNLLGELLTLLRKEESRGTVYDAKKVLEIEKRCITNISCTKCGFTISTKRACS